MPLRGILRKFESQHSKNLAAVKQQVLTLSGNQQITFMPQNSHLCHVLQLHQTAEFNSILCTNLSEMCIVARCPLLKFSVKAGWDAKIVLPTGPAESWEVRFRGSPLQKDAVSHGSRRLSKIIILKIFKLSFPCWWL